MKNRAGSGASVLLKFRSFAALRMTTNLLSVAGEFLNSYANKGKVKKSPLFSGLYVG